MSVDRDISIAMSRRLSTIPGLPVIVSWESGRPVEPVSGQVFIQEFMLPAETTAFSLRDNEPNEYTGIYQVSVFIPLGYGAAAALEEAGKIQDHFARGTELTENTTRVRIDRPASVSRAVENGAWWMYPVRIRYRVII